MKYRMTVKNKSLGQWDETVDSVFIDTLEAARDNAERIVTAFNATLRPGEEPRTLVDVVLIGPSDPRCDECGTKLIDGVLCPRCDTQEDEESRI